MNILSIEKNFYKQRKKPQRINKNIKKILSKSFIFHGEIEIEIQHFSKLNIAKNTIAIGNLLIYFGDFLLKDSYFYAIPDKNGRFKIKFNKVRIQKDKYLFGNKISFVVGKFHVQHNLEHEDRQKLKSRIIHCIMNVDIPDFDQDDKK